MALPAPFYVRPEAHEAETGHIFRRSWQLLGHAARVDGIGDHLVAQIAGLPLLLVRAEDGQLRALHNVCRHRAGPLAVCDGRGARSLRCRYHGWTYQLDGQLRAATEMQGVPDFDPGTVRLPQARVGSWRGLVFAALDDSAPQLEVLLAAVDRRLGARDFSQYRFARRVSYDIECNWKTYVDNYLEGYHLPHIHPGLNRLLDYRSYQIETDIWSSLQFSPLEGSGPYAQGEAFYWFIWPNIMLNVLPGRLQTNQVIPLAPQRCRVEFDFYYPGELAGAELETVLEADLAFSDQVQQEDIAICEQVQSGLASGSYVCGRLNPLREPAVWQFHERVRAAWREA